MRICGFKWNSLSKWIFYYFLDVKKEKREKRITEVNQVFRLSTIPYLVGCFQPLQLESFKMESAQELVIPNEFSRSNPNKLFDA